MTINKSYSVSINSTNKYADGQQNYLPISVKTTTSIELDSRLDPMWSAKYSDGISCVGIGCKNLNDFYYLLDIRIPFMTSVSLTPWKMQ